jgi:AraC-like DNA-binding protein
MARTNPQEAPRDWVSQVRPGDSHVTADAAPAVHYNGPDYDAPRLSFHMHEDLEIGICLAGETKRYFGGAGRVVTPGDIWLCGMWEPHAWRNAPGFEGLHFYVPPQGVWEPLEREGRWVRMFTVPVEERPRATTAEMRATLLALGREMMQECQARRKGWRDLGWAALVRLLVTLERGWSPPEGGVGPSPSRPADIARILPALALTQASLGRSVSVEEAAAACGLSPSRFRTIFRHTMGISYGKYGVRARVASAASRLLAGNAPIETVAQQTGFTDRSHLSRMFVAFHGCTPAEFRRRNAAAQA